jgi:WD40 repeat protein
MYNAFISYSHAADGKLAPALQEGLEKFAKPWYKIRNLNIFRDEASLSASPHLWANIQKALDQSEYLIYMASPVSASSIWVGREIEYWITNKPIDKLLIVLTDGEIPWDNRNNNFLNPATNALPDVLDKKFSAEPFYIDLRTAKSQQDLSLNNPIFKKEVLKLAAQLHHKEPKDLAGEEVTVHRKMLRTRNTAVAVLAFFFVAALVAAWLAIQNAKEAVRERNTAQANYLASEAQRFADIDPTLAIRLAEASMKQHNDSFIFNVAQSIYRKNSFYRTIATLHRTDSSYNSFTTTDYSPDGKFIITGSGDGIPRLWDNMGKLIRKFKAHSRFISSAGFSPDGKSILTQADSTIRIWDLDGNLVQEIVDRSGIVAQAVTGPGIQDFESYVPPIKRFLETYSKLSKKFSGNIFSSNKVAVSPDGKFSATDDFNNEVTVSDIDGKPLHKFKPHKSFLTSISFSPDGKSILTSSYDSTARLSDLTGKLLAEFRGHSNVVIDAVFSPDGKMILTAAHDGSCKLWNSDGILIQDFKGDFFGVNCVDFSPDGKTIVSGCDRTLRLWNITNKPLHRFVHNNQVSSVAFSPDGKSVLTGSYDYSARLWDTSGKLLTEFKGHSSIITAAIFSPDGKSVLTGSWDYTIRLHKLDGTLIHEFKDSKGSITCLAISPDGKSILSGSDDSTALLWDINGKIIQEFKLHGTISAVAFSPDGTYMLIGSWNDTPKLFDSNGKLIHEFISHAKFCSSLAFSPDSKWVLTGGGSNENFVAQLWTLEGKFVREFAGHNFQVISVAFAPDGKSILTGARDNTAKWWNLNGQLIQEFKGFMGSVNSVAFSPDGKLILAGISDNTARLWKAAPPLDDFLKSDQIDPLNDEQKKKFGIK